VKRGRARRERDKHVYIPAELTGSPALAQSPYRRASSESAGWQLEASLKKEKKGVVCCWRWRWRGDGNGGDGGEGVSE
jgi:hypothetical protein